MKFCMLTTFYPPFNHGGDGVYVEALSRELVKRGHEVTVAHCVDAYRLNAPSVTSDAPETSMQDGVRVHRLRSRFGLLSPLLTQQTGLPGLKTRRLREILATGFDVVNYHNISLIGGPGLLELPAGPALKLWTVHEHWFLCSTHIFWKNKEKRCDRRECLTCCLRSGIPPQLWRLSGLPRRAVAQVDALIAPSRFTADLHRDAVAPVPVHVLPLFSRIMPDLDPRNAVADTQGHGLGGYFIFVGRMTASKGVRPMLDAFARLPQLRIKLAGGGELLDRLRVDFAACANIEFLGAVPADRLPALYSQALAVVLPSLAPETFGLALVEGMAFGAPAIVHDAGGCREIVETSGAGFVFRDFAELPALLSRFAVDHEMRQALSVQARQAFAAFYTPQRHLAGYLALIDAALDSRRRHA